MIKPISYDKPYRCPECGGDVEIYDTQNRPIGFKNMVDNGEYAFNTLEAFEGRYIADMACTTCKSRFTIYWTQAMPYPKPITIAEVIEKYMISNK